MEITNLTIKSFHEGLLEKKFSALEVTQAHFEEIKKNDGATHAYLTLLEDSALREAEAADLAVARGEDVAPLAGVPLAIKDNILIQGECATAGSKILETYRASYDAHVITQLKSAGAVFLGKTNLDEFAMGSSTESSAFGATKNPHDHARVAGGSSGGSATAVAGHMAVASLGSDTGGSIREPAAFCGVVGLKPTYGAVSRSGLIALASSLDQIGPITKTVRDAALVFDAIRGKDTMDATSIEAPYGEELTEPKLERVKKLAVGIPEEYFIEGIAPEVQRGVQSAMDAIQSLGLSFKKISLPHTRYALSTYYIIMPAEASANLARFDGIRYARSRAADQRRTDADRHGNGQRESASSQRRSALEEIYFKQRALFGAEAKRRIMLGTFVLSSGYYDAYYKKAQQVRSLIARDFENAFREVDVILTPVTPTPAFKIGEKTDDPLAMYLADIFTIPVNLAGLPAISIPVQPYNLQPPPAPRLRRAGKTYNLPIGFQLIGRHFREEDILGLGMCYEKITASLR